MHAGPWGSLVSLRPWVALTAVQIRAVPFSDSVEAIEGENIDFEAVAKHDELRERVVQHRFVWEYTRTDAGEIEAYSFAWEPGHSQPLTPEIDLVVIGYVKQYLEHHGVGDPFAVIGIVGYPCSFIVLWSFRGEPQ